LKLALSWNLFKFSNSYLAETALLLLENSSVPYQHFACWINIFVTPNEKEAFQKNPTEQLEKLEEQIWREIVEAEGAPQIDEHFPYHHPRLIKVPNKPWQWSYINSQKRLGDFALLGLDIDAAQAPKYRAQSSFICPTSQIRVHI